MLVGCRVPVREMYVNAGGLVAGEGAGSRRKVKRGRYGKSRDEFLRNREHRASRWPKQGPGVRSGRRHYVEDQFGKVSKVHAKTEPPRTSGARLEGFQNQQSYSYKDVALLYITMQAESSRAGPKIGIAFIIAAVLMNLYP